MDQPKANAPEEGAATVGGDFVSQMAFKNVIPTDITFDANNMFIMQF
jgi:hypothetical protein